MKHISAYFDQVERAVERFAWLPVRSSFSKQLIWFSRYIELQIYFDNQGKPPVTGRSWNWFSRYIELQIYFDNQGKPPVKGRSWNLIYTLGEYTYYCLAKEPKNQLP
jgi:hypothetical protein